MLAQYDALMALIDINLDRLEAYWVEQGTMYMNTNNETALFASKKDALVINYFLENPEMKIETIAAACCVHKSTAARIITNWYEQKKGATMT